MGVYLKILNLDQLFWMQSKHNPVIINDFREHSEEKRKIFNEQIFTRYQPNDVLSNVPSCNCGNITSQFNKGIVCPKCNTPVTNLMDQEIQSLLWLRAPNKVKKLINPMIWAMLCERFKKGRFNVIQWLCDTDYRCPTKPPKVFFQIEKLGIQRGYNNFVTNFDVIIDKLLTLKDFRKESKKSRDHPAFEEKILSIIKRNRDSIFSDYIPLPNRIMLVVEDTNLSTFTDPITPGAINAISSMIGLDDPLNNYNLRTRENRVVRSLAGLALFYSEFYRHTVSAKEGVARKHLFGTRCYWSARAVITSLTGPHRYDEIHIPWGVGVGLLKEHLISKLYRLDYTPNEARKLLNGYTDRYHPLLDKIFKELIANTENGLGMHCVFGRNPSLERGSLQCKYITQVKTKVDDVTIGMSILSVKAYNADYDGDEMNLSLSVDNEMAYNLRYLDGHHGALDISEPRKMSSNLAKPKPVISTLAHWLETAEDEPPDPVKQQRMLELFT